MMSVETSMPGLAGPVVGPGSVGRMAAVGCTTWLLRGPTPTI